MPTETRRSLLPAFTAAVLAGAASPATACDSTTFIGTVCIIATDYCPKGFAKADGRLLSVSSNVALSSLLGNAFGGDGVTTFALPDLRGRAIVGSGQGAGFADVKRGQKIGQQQVTLMQDQVPVPIHTHGATLPSAKITVSGTVSGTATGKIVVAVPASDRAGDLHAPDPTTYIAASSQNVELSFAKSANTTLRPVEVGASLAVSGSLADGVVGVTIQPTAIAPSLPVPTQSPAQVLTVCIATEGEYPPRN